MRAIGLISFLVLIAVVVHRMTVLDVMRSVAVLIGFASVIFGTIIFYTPKRRKQPPAHTRHNSPRRWNHFIWYD